MALVECRECGKSVSTQAANCPHCGAPQAESNTSKPSKRGSGASVGRIIVGVVIAAALLGIVARQVLSNRTKTSTVASNLTSTVKKEPGCDIRKADGSEPDRECDLVELCKDARYYDQKATQATLSGDVAERVKAAATLQRVLLWMSAYRPEDVAATCGISAKSTSASSSGATGGPVVADATANKPIGVCSVPPLEVFPVRYAFTEVELRQEIARKCAGAALEQDGSIAVKWSDKSYLVETAKIREASGLLIYEVISVRAR